MENKDNESGAQEFNIDEYTKKVFDIEFVESPDSVDLRTCYRGDKLLCKDGRTVYYVQPLPPSSFYEHEIAEKEDLKPTGSRTNTGKVLKASNTDSDIIQIIRK